MSSSALKALAIFMFSVLAFTWNPPPVLGRDTSPDAASESGWKVMKKDGIHWIVTPRGERFFSKGVNIVCGGRDTPQDRNGKAYHWANFFGSEAEWRRAANTQLETWGFNTRGGWSDTSTDFSLALTVDLELGRNAHFHWFDPFDPAMESRTREWAERLTEPYRGDPRLIGYYSDNEVGWWNVPLFEWYLKAPWDSHTKRVLWQLLYDHYEGDWNRFLADWVPQGNPVGFEDLKPAGCALKLRQGGHGIRLVDRFMFLIARRYYELMAQAIRHAHPGALYLGDRLPLYYHQDAILAMEDSVDVISTNYNVDVPDGWVAPYYFEGLQRLSSKPVLVTEFFFAAEENRSGNRNETARNRHPKPGHLMTVDTQAGRAWGAANALINFSRFPNVVGAHWFQYADEPEGGREDGEDYNMGLVDTSNCPYDDMTKTFQSLNPVLELYHEGSVASSSKSAAGASPDASKETFSRNVLSSPPDAAPLFRTDTPIDVSDQSLLDWNKEKTRLAGFQAPAPYVPFGDVHAAWAPQGLYLASIANTFLAPEFLAYEGEFPLEEAFQLRWQVALNGRTHNFLVALIPSRPDPEEPDGFRVEPRFYRMTEGGELHRLPLGGHVQRIAKCLPHMMLEVFIPASWLGVADLQPGMQLGMSIGVTNTYREFSMFWSGAPSLSGLAAPDVMKTVVLQDGEAVGQARIF